MKELELCCLLHRTDYFYLGIVLVLGVDIWLQLERGHIANGFISEFTTAAIGIFIVNILLWVDFNISFVRRKKQNEPQTSRLRCVTKRSLFILTRPSSKKVCHQAIGSFPGDDSGAAQRRRRHLRLHNTHSLGLPVDQVTSL